jgi:excisionase family DNA binding protein
MTQYQFLQSFENLQSEVQEVKTLLQRVLIISENKVTTKTDPPSLTEEWVTVKEGCKILKCSDVTLWKLRKKGTLPYSKLNGSVRLKKSILLNYLNQQ